METAVLARPLTVPPYEALRYLAGRPAHANEGALGGLSAVRHLAEIGLSDIPEPLARSGRDERGWFIVRGQSIESDVSRIRAWCAAADVALREAPVDMPADPPSATLFERAIADAGFEEPVPFVDWWSLLPSLVHVYKQFAQVVSWRARLGFARAESVPRPSGLVVPRTSTGRLDDRACAVLVGALFSWTSGDIPYVQHGLIKLGESAWKRGGSAVVRGMFRMRECAERAGAWECMRALDEWLARRSRDVGDTPYDATSLPPHAGAMRLVHAVPYGVDSVIGALADAEVEDPRDVHFALEVALETGQVEAGRLIAHAYLPKITHVVADRPRGSNAVDVVELAGMLCDAGGDVDAGTRLFRRALEMPVWGGTRFRTWWLRQRIERGPRFFFDSRWSVVPMGR